jgi:hypothetical protein
MSTPITTIDFQDKFAVRIVDYTANADTNDVHVEFEVTCKLNQRTSLYKTEVGAESLVEEYTSQDVLDTAWNNVKQDVNAWSTSTVVKSQIETYTPLTTTNSISLLDFNENFDVHVTRFDLYPIVKPLSWCIGFSVVMKSRLVVLSVDCAVSTTEFCGNTLCKSIVGAGWDVLKERICDWAADEFSKVVVLNSAYVPTDIDSSNV